MKLLSLGLPLASLLVFSFTGLSHAAEAQPAVIAIAGDSTVATVPDEAKDVSGWGAALVKFAKPGVKVDNFAVGGRSSRSFRTEGYWDKVLGVKPNWVLIQFGHNDMAGKGPSRESKPESDYRDHLRRYIQEVQAIGGKPVLITPVCRRIYTKEGVIGAGLVPYADAVKIVAEEMKVPYLDLHEYSRKEFERVGPVAAATLAPKERPNDQTHFSRAGAEIIGSWVLLLMKEKVPELAAEFVEVPVAALPTAAATPAKQ